MDAVESAVVGAFGSQPDILAASALDRIAALDQHTRLIAGAFWTIPGSPWTLENLWDAPQQNA